jgi:hypothetical protein
MVVRCFDDGNIVHVDGSIDPVRDVETILTELCLADLETVEKGLQRVDKIRKYDKVAEAAFEVYGVHQAGIDDRETRHRRRGGRGTGKEYQGTKPPDPQAIPLYRQRGREGRGRPPCEPVLQETLRLLRPERRDAPSHLRQNRERSGRAFGRGCGAVFIRRGHQGTRIARHHPQRLRNPQPHLVLHGRADGIQGLDDPQGNLAPQAAGVIHTDFERGFIKAEVVSYEDYDHFEILGQDPGSGKYRTEGKEYVMRDGDVVHFKFNVT